MGINNRFRSVADGEGDKFDPFSRAVTVIQEQHRMGHEGMMYHSSGKVAGMIDANVDEFLLVTPAGSFPHMQGLTFTFGRGDIDILIYEGATASADGTPQTLHNTNRNSPNTPVITWGVAPTLSDDGTLIHTAWAAPTATGTGQSATGITGINNGEEWILKPSTKYLVRVTNNSGSTIDYRWELLWYEIDWTKGVGSAL